MVSRISLKPRALNAACFLLKLGTVRTFVLALALLLTGPLGRSASADSRQDTEAALAAERKATSALATALATQRELDSRYQAELRSIDRLKKQRGSWRRDRQLRDSLAASLETAKKLEAATAAVQREARAQAQARKRSEQAVLAELRATTEPARLSALQRERARLAPSPATSKKIVIPELTIDPLADPEELEQQALAIRQSEQALAQQVALLDDRSRRLDGQAELRRQHDRAEDLADRDDGRARRSGVQRSTSGAENDAAAPAGGGAPNHDPSADPAPNPNPTPPPVADARPLSAQASGVSDVAVLAESSAVLGEVIDATTLEALRKAQSSSDPAVRAAAAKLARDSAAAKLSAIRKQRALIEARVRALRGADER